MKRLWLLVVIPMSFCVVGCQIPYLLKNSWHQTKILKSRKSISEILKDPDTPASLKEKLLLVQRARQFSVKTLGLVESDNYSSYVDLKRDYVTWIVRAAPKVKLQPYQWWFPITGHVPYKGYFSKDGAVEEAEDLKKDGYDTYIRGVTAYSTLGWFEDPVLNTMLKYDDYNLVNLIIHETVHATLFIKSKVDFNERLATFIGNIGAQKFFESYPEGDQLLQQAEQENQDQNIFSEFISEEIESLKKWYDQTNEADALISRDNKFNDIKTRFKEKVLPKMQTDRFHYFEKIPLNNAVLLSYETYQANLDIFNKLYEKLGHDFHALIDYCKKLEKAEDPEKVIREFVESG